MEGLAAGVAAPPEKQLTLATNEFKDFRTTLMYVIRSHGNKLLEAIFPEVFRPADKAATNGSPWELSERIIGSLRIRADQRRSVSSEFITLDRLS